MSFHLFLYYCVNDFSLQSHLRKPSLLSLLSSNTRHSAPCPGPPVFWEFPIESQLLVTVMCKRMQCAMACAEQFPFTVPFNSGITPLGRLLSLPFAKEETEKEWGTLRSAELNSWGVHISTSIRLSQASTPTLLWHLPKDRNSCYIYLLVLSSSTVCVTP